MKNFLKKIVWLGFILLPFFGYCQTFSEVQKIVTQNRRTENFGSVVAISGQFAAISSHESNGKNSVYIFQKNSSGRWMQIQEIISPDNRPFDAFGYSIDMDKDYLIIGDFANSITSNPSTAFGAAYIYKKDINNQWVYISKLLASDRAAGDLFGWSVSIKGKKCLVGAIYNNPNDGAVYVFEEDINGVWIQTYKVQPTNINSGFLGYTQCLSDSIIIAGAPRESRDEIESNPIFAAGAVYVYELNSSGVWTQRQKIVAFDRRPSLFFGSSITINGNLMMINSGSYQVSIDNIYAQTCGVYIYEKNAFGIWEFKQKLTPPDPNNHLGFSNLISLHGNYLAVAAIDEREDNNGNVLGLYTGAVYIYKRQANGLWDSIQRIVSSDIAAGDYFGRSLAMEGNQLIVGAYEEGEDENGQNTIDRAGSAYVFELNMPPKDTIEKCYASTPFVPSSDPIGVEKKWESNIEFKSNGIPLIYDINNDGIPEIIMSKYDNSLKSLSNEIVIINSIDGTVVSTIQTPFHHNSLTSTILVADVDSDCHVDLIISCSGSTLNSSEIRNRLVCMNFNGEIKWISNDIINYNGLTEQSEYNFGTISITDFNNDGIPEIYVYNEIFNARTGVKILDGGNFGKGISKDIGQTIYGVTIAANLDNSPELELAAGYTIYKINITNPNGLIGNSMTPYNLDFNGHFVDGFTSVADINMDGFLDVIVSSKGLYNTADNLNVGLYCYTFRDEIPEILLNVGRYKLNANRFNSGLASVIYNPISAQHEIIFVLDNGLQNAIVSVSYDSTNGFKINWEFPVWEPSSFTGVTASDLDGDGTVELVHCDHDFLRILKLTNTVPIELDRISCLNSTYSEYPVIADIDGTDQSKICVTCAKKLSDQSAKLTVFGAPEGQRWAPARNIWHQYAYNPLFINDDGTVPQFQENHATYKNGKYNNFMVQESLIDENGNVPVPAASLHGEMYCAEYQVDNDEITVFFNIVNKENASLAAAINTPVSFYDGNPESGGVLLTTYYTTQVINAGENVSSLSVTLPADITGPIWMVINTDKINPVLSDSSQYFIPECDYTDNVFVLYDLPVIDKITAEICEGDVYDFMGQMLTTTGQYIIETQNQIGCDSAIYILNLTATNVKTSEEDITECDTFTWNATTYSQSGTYTYQTMSSNGCDSIATLHLTIHPSSESEASINACDTYVWNGNTYTESGMYTYQTMNSVGCDSTATLHLNISPSYADTTFVTTCDTYLWNGNTYSSNGTYLLQTQSSQGCDSVSTLVLNIQNTIETEENITACDRYNWNGNTYTQSGEYTYQTTSSSGCDSIVTLYLDVFPSVTTQENISACDTLIWQNQILTTSGMYTHQEMTFQGCDSIRQLFLTILPSTTSQAQIQTCESYEWNGQTYTSSGLYTYQTNNHVGCDSTAHLDLTIHPKVNENINVSTCYPYEWHGETYTQSGMYSITQPNQFGCDSTTNLQLTIHPTYQNSLSLSACTAVEYQHNTYTTSGNYEVMLQSVFGCDSIINLTININAQSFEESQSVCDSFYWPQSDQHYQNSGIYQEVFTNQMGCDSSYQLTLEIHPSYMQTEAKEVCETYTWPNNQQTYTQSGIYTIQRQTQRGCDSIQTLDLTIYEGFRKRDTIIADSSYTWPVNGITYETSGAYEERYINAEGCDSIHYLVLRIESTYTIQFPNIITGGTNVHPFKGYSSHDNVIIKELSIYDRMASRVYHIENTRVNDPNYGWNGTFRDMEVVPGVYVWMVELILPDGSTKQMAGDVTIIR